MWVLKIGGSLQNAGNLPDFLTMLAEHAAGRVVIVPGGGVFADHVRELQAETNLDDVTAHGMALRAMEQFGTMLIAYASELQPARSLDEVAQLSAAKNAARMTL